MLVALHDHFVSLETRIQVHRDRLTGLDLSPDERASIESELKVAELALQHYRTAIDLEHKLEIA